MDKNDEDYKLAKKILFDGSLALAVSENNVIILAEIFKRIREEGREEERKVELDRRAKMKNDMI